MGTQMNRAHTDLQDVPLSLSLSVHSCFFCWLLHNTERLQSSKNLACSLLSLVRGQGLHLGQQEAMYASHTSSLEAFLPCLYSRGCISCFILLRSAIPCFMPAIQRPSNQNQLNSCSCPSSCRHVVLVCAESVREQYGRGGGACMHACMHANHCSRDLGQG